jgi:hypothetical protein
MRPLHRHVGFVPITVIGGRHSTTSSERIAGDEKIQRQDVTPEAYWPASHL